MLNSEIFLKKFTTQLNNNISCGSIDHEDLMGWVGWLAWLGHLTIVTVKFSQEGNQIPRVQSKIEALFFCGKSSQQHKDYSKRLVPELAW